MSFNATPSRHEHEGMPGLASFDAAAPNNSVDNIDTLSTSSFESSDDGMLEEEWVSATIDEWRHRPEPQRSDALRNMCHKLKVRDGRERECNATFQ